MASHMTPELHQQLIRDFDNPVHTFVKYPITIKSKKKFDENLPDEMKFDLDPDYIGLASSLHLCSDLAYEIAETIPNKTEKLIAIGLLHELSKNLSKACEPTI